MGSLDNAAGSAQKFLSILMGGAVVAFIAFGVVAKMPSWYANRKLEAARNAPPGINMLKMDTGGPRTYLASETTVDYTPNAKIIRTKTWQVNETGYRR